MQNERGAGRKPVLKYDDINSIRERLDAGESVAFIAKEYGVSRQAIYKRLRSMDNQVIILEYVVEGEVSTIIEANVFDKSIQIKNVGQRLSRYAFGINSNPNWKDFCLFLEKQLMRSDIYAESGCKRFLVKETDNYLFSLNDVIGGDNMGIRVISDADIHSIPKFTFEKRDILYSRTDTDGYQLKAISRDRKFFVKSQAVISGVFLNDWAVELMASDICEQLGISCIKQHECEIVYGNRVYKGVYSNNFELDGYTFISFERLLERMGLSSKDPEFIHFDAMDKMKWCAEKLSIAGDLEYKKTFKYMLDLAIVDCIIGNVDRHTKNFGLFFNSFTGKYEIPLIFDNGMGLFENDNYRDNYESYDSAMMNVYVAPYGEDPFDMINLLMKEMDLVSIYPGLLDFNYNDRLNTSYSKIYMERIKKIWQK